MKKIVVLLIILNLTYACTTPKLDEDTIPAIVTNTNGNTSRTAAPISAKRYYAKNSLVVKFANGVTETIKSRARNYYGVSNYELCKNCDNKLIELWMFDPTIEIEPKKETISIPPPPGSGLYPPTGGYRPIEYVEFNYDIKVDSNSKSNLLHISNSNNLFPPATNYSSYLALNNEGVTIAVMDTGINPSLGMSAYFRPKFLYNSTFNNTPGIYSGWDFVNNDHDCADDDPNQHGTAVTSVITRQLNSYGIPYQIMPLKVCNSMGNGSYFNLLCSLSFALERKVSIVQMSLGWYNLNGNITDNIFTNLVNQYATVVPHLVIVCSAGNDGETILINSNNDTNYHCPSGFALSNIIAVASCTSDYTNISSFSNYGATTVDFFAKGEDIPFLLNPIRGTSFAAPVVAAKTALYNYQNHTNSGVLESLINTGMQKPGSFTSSKPVYHNKIIVP